MNNENKFYNTHGIITAELIKKLLPEGIDVDVRETVELIVQRVSELENTVAGLEGDSFTSVELFYADHAIYESLDAWSEGQQPLTYTQVRSLVYDPKKIVTVVDTGVKLYPILDHSKSSSEQAIEFSCVWYAMEKAWLERVIINNSSDVLYDEIQIPIYADISKITGDLEEKSHNILKVAANRTSSGVTMTVNADYTITVNGTSTSAGGAHAAIDGAVGNYYFPLEIGGVYTFLVEHLEGNSSSSPKFRYCTGSPDMNNGTLREIANGETLYIDKVTYVMFCFGIRGDVYSNDKYRVCINKGTSHIPMDYNGTVSVEALQNERIDNLKSDNKDSVLLIPHREFLVDKLESNISSVQGVCEYTVNGVVYLAIGFKIDSTHSGIALVNSAGEVIKEVFGTNYGHVNSITFCDKDKRIYIGASSSTSPTSLCYSLNATTLENKVELNISAHSIWYYDEAFYFVSGNNLRKWSYGEQATAYTNIAVLPSVGYTAQNICILNDVLLYTYWDSANRLTRIYKYCLDGTLLSSDSVYTNGEGEHGYVYNNKAYVVIDEKEVDGFTFTRKLKCYEYTGSVAPIDAHINALIEAKLAALHNLLSENQED